ncbi:TPA: hypothetical protein OPR05_001712 [Citrobacter koseri]|nr:hypothetical protein [Citrobacter koseri]HCR9763038.1 hypothetical protein [Citrobacter koseri]
MKGIEAIRFFGSPSNHEFTEIVVFSDSEFKNAPNGCPTGTDSIWEYFRIHGDYKGMTECAIDENGFLFGFKNGNVVLLSDVECQMNGKYYKREDRTKS